MTICYMVPGLLGSELYSNNLVNSRIWANPSRLMTGGVGFLRLDAEGVNAGGEDGRPLTAGNPLPDYWDAPASLLSQSLLGFGYRVDTFGYDWRLRIKTNGELLAQKIRVEVVTGDPCAIVAHSMGGLVARWAWSDLGRTGDQAKVRRIVTLGTPHQGTYAAVSALSLDFDPIRQLTTLVNLAPVIGNAAAQHPAWHVYTPNEIRDILATWPSVYQILPALGSRDASADINRHMLYDAAAWGYGVSLSAAHLEESRTAFGPWLTSAESLPPPWVLTTVGGTGYITPDGLLYPSVLGSPLALGASGDGDGLVTRASALVEQSARFTVTSAHNDLALAVATSGDLANWVLDVRAAPSPPPAAQLVTGLASFQLAGPPLTAPIAQAAGSHSCPAGLCRC